jgi:5-formyltetrahydrofolate cyclo-ligase
MKQLIREEIALALAQLTPEERAEAVSTLIAQLNQRLLEAQPTYIGVFLPMHDEPDLRERYAALLRSGKQLYLPSVDTTGAACFAAFTAHTTLTHTGGRPHPTPSAPVLSDDLDLLIVPGRAFTLSGARLGRGSGWYDRWLAQHADVVTIGVCFACQLLDTLPVEPHDMVVDEVIFS